MFQRILFVALTFLIALSSRLSAEATVAIGYQPGSRANATFRLPTVPSPVQGDAASRGKWLVISGTADPASGGLGKLSNDQLPRSADQPAENFFFAPATPGGRLRLELDRSTEIAQIRTYSWHPRERAPQVYTVYGCDQQEVSSGGKLLENDESVQLKPSGTIDPASCGWTKIATVDTRRDGIGHGGQVGVVISASDHSVNDQAIGHYRYLLFDIHPTRPDARFSNTFFSEIDILDADADVTPAKPIATPDIVTYAIEEGGYEFTLDTSECPDLTRWADQELAPVVQQWYPKIAEMLASDDYEAPHDFQIRISSSMDGVAATSGTQVTCSANWYRRNLRGEAKGATVHELVHVVQQYGQSRRTNRRAARTPGWVVEGIADYVRWHLYEPASAGGGVAGRRPRTLQYDASYRDTAAFLAWVITNGNPDLLAKLNAAARSGTYSAAFWKAATGKTVDELATAWHADLEN